MDTGQILISTAKYGDPVRGNNSTVNGKPVNGKPTTQIQAWTFSKNSIIQKAHKRVFTLLGDSIKLNPNSGLDIKEYTYVPLLSKWNINDQGIDQNGKSIPNGNLYGDSDDIGDVTSKLPYLKESGGYVNRVFIKRYERHGTLQELGFFLHYTDAMLNYDSDAKLWQILHDQSIDAGLQITDQMLGRDLLINAGVTILAGAASSMKEMNEGSEVTDPDTNTVTKLPPSVVDYALFDSMDAILTENRADMATEIITGSTKNDTRTIPACRLLYVGKYYKKYLKTLTDNFGKPAFIPVHQYADAAQIIHPKEIGAIGEFRVIQVDDMLCWRGAGDVVTGKTEYYASMGSDGKLRYDVFPMLCVTPKSFATIYFDQDISKNNPFKVLIMKPGSPSLGDAYGKTGSCSIQWKYGFLAREPEKILVVKSLLKR